LSNFGERVNLRARAAVAILLARCWQAVELKLHDSNKTNPDKHPKVTGVFYPPVLTISTSRARGAGLKNLGRSIKRPTKFFPTIPLSCYARRHTQIVCTL
jgi:hypothetical protein